MLETVDVVVVLGFDDASDVAEVDIDVLGLGVASDVAEIDADVLGDVVVVLILASKGTMLDMLVGTVADPVKFNILPSICINHQLQSPSWFLSRMS